MTTTIILIAIFTALLMVWGFTVLNHFFYIAWFIERQIEKMKKNFWKVLTDFQKSDTIESDQR